MIDSRYTGPPLGEVISRDDETPGEFQKSTAGDAVMKLVRKDGKWVARASTIERGLVAFCKTPIPSDFIGFVVTRINETGRSLVVTPFSQPPIEVIT